MPIMKKTVKNLQGFTLVEALLSVALLSLIFTAVSGAFIYGLQGQAWGGQRARAVFLAEEGLSATQNIRDAGYVNLVDGTYGLSTLGSQWSFSGSSDNTGTGTVFSRQVTISTVDAATKNVSSTITWSPTPYKTNSVTLVTYLTNWLTNTVGGSWTSLAQAGVLDLSGNQNGLKVQVAGDFAYVIRNGGSTDFLVVNITDPVAPILVGSLNSGTTLTNIAVSGNYAYVTSTSNSQEMLIIDLNNPLLPIVVGTYNASGNANAQGVAVSGDTVYLVRVSSGDAEFETINVTNKALPVTLGTLNLIDTGNEVAISGNYAYVVSSSNTHELEIINITVPAIPTLAGFYDFAGSTTNAVTVVAYGDKIYLGNSNSLYIFQDTVHTTATLLGSVPLAGLVNDLVFDGSNLIFAATSNSTADFRVVDISVPASPAIISSVDLTGTEAFGVAYDPTLDQCVVASEANVAEFIMVTHP